MLSRLNRREVDVSFAVERLRKWIVEPKAAGSRFAEIEFRTRVSLIAFGGRLSKAEFGQGIALDCLRRSGGNPQLLIPGQKLRMVAVFFPEPVQGIVRYVYVPLRDVEIDSIQLIPEQIGHCIRGRVTGDGKTRLLMGCRLVHSSRGTVDKSIAEGE